MEKSAAWKRWGFRSMKSFSVACDKDKILHEALVAHMKALSQTHLQTILDKLHAEKRKIFLSLKNNWYSSSLFIYSYYLVEYHFIFLVI